MKVLPKTISLIMWYKQSTGKKKIRKVFDREEDKRKEKKALPIVVPSSPIMHFIEVMICWATGGDMEAA